MRKTVVVMSVVMIAGVALSACQTVGSGRGRVEKTPAACQDMTVPVYFEPNVAQLTPEGRRVIAAAARTARPCKVDSVTVLGLADAAGDPAANLELSRKRADAVAGAIARAGLPAAVFAVEAVGQAGSVTADGKVVPVRRRADIALKLGRPK
ncbi:OmpA family protein [Phenylobacterium sp.]|uniref:OmpA family protein n=1 Tax=Phenylobacterium sp. TaxID=1871053 RepID=UPI0025E84FCE|nr:OmpA family protein [Phenylobacterium sp.]MBX3483638.1 OmpA family protein [Phenylobacterium sp.]